LIPYIRLQNAGCKEHPSWVSRQETSLTFVGESSASAQYKKALDRRVHTFKGFMKTFLLCSRVICKEITEIPPALSSTPVSYFPQAFYDNPSFE
jgi:hypothetical protein